MKLMTTDFKLPSWCLVDTIQTVSSEKYTVGITRRQIISTATYRVMNEIISVIGHVW